MRFALPQMLVQGGGAIVNTASISGFFGEYRMGAYNAAKAGVVTLTKTAAIEYARKNIRVNAVCPGMIATPKVLAMPAEVQERVMGQIPAGRYGKPAEIADLVAFLASERAAYITGQDIAVDGGIGLMQLNLGRAR